MQGAEAVAWRGELGSFDVIPPASPREARRRAVEARRALERLQARLADAPGDKVSELRSAIATAEAEVRDARDRELATVHRDATPAVDWRNVAACPPPLLPQLDRARSTEAAHRLRTYRPDPMGLIDRRTLLQAELERLIDAEETDRAERMEKWRTQMHGWSAWCSLTARILRGDLLAYREAIDASGCLDEIHEVLEPSSIAIELAARSARIEIDVDAERFGTTYALGAPLRVARELLAVLPIAHAIVQLRAPDEQARLLQIGRDTEAQPDWQRASPQDAIAWLSEGRFTPGGWRATYG